MVKLQAAGKKGRGLRFLHALAMILNPYAELDGFLTLFRLVLAASVLINGVRAWPKHRGGLSQVRKEDFENRCYLLFLCALVLLALNVASWPVFYMLLQSYVSTWKAGGVMCIYGVTQIGSGSIGVSRFLPGLLHVEETLKPVLVFVGGAWLVLYLLNRGTRSAPLAGRVLLLLVVLGLLATGDALAESAYLIIPKKEEVASSGCCTAVFDSAGDASRFLPQALVGDGYRSWLYGGFYAVNSSLVLALFAVLRFARLRASTFWLVAILTLTVFSLGFNGLFLVEVIAPVLLHLPYHHCPYDLVPGAPESMVAVGMYLFSVFAVGWACVASWLGRDRETETQMPVLVFKLLGLGLFACLASLVMISLELILA